MKKICLGTALCGWKVDEKACEEIALEFVEHSPPYFDTAANYPLNGDGVSFRLASKILSKILSKNSCLAGGKIIYKIGAVCNKRTPESDLSPENLEKERRICDDLFGNSGLLMVHWDNRDNISEIKETLSFLNETNTSGCIALSGIKYPELYAEALKELKLSPKKILVECKHNFVLSDIDKYKKIFGNQNVEFISYGIAAGGIKLEKSEYDDKSYVRLARNSSYHDSVMTGSLAQKIRSKISENRKIKNIYDYAMDFQENSDSVTSYIIAPSTLGQMCSINTFRTEY